MRTLEIAAVKLAYKLAMRDKQWKAALIAINRLGSLYLTIN